MDRCAETQGAWGLRIAPGLSAAMNCHQVVFIPNTDVTGTNRGPRQILAFSPATRFNLSITLRRRVSAVSTALAGRHTIEVLEQVFRDRMRNLQ